MKTYLFLLTLICCNLIALSQDMSGWSKDLNAVLLQKEVYQTQVTFPANPYVIRFDVPNLYYKELNIKNVNVIVRKGIKAELTGHLYEVLVSCNGTEPCMDVNIGVGKTFKDASMRLLFEEERDAQIVAELLMSYQQQVSEW
ncbi:MAG: hypothetical protein K1X92_16790 [Bacteroidia bacterium]|nr:hypothetical protein [Bacteroidia bacterium]